MSNLNFINLLLILLRTSFSTTEFCQLKWPGQYYKGERVIPMIMNDTHIDSVGECIAMSASAQYFLFRHRINFNYCYRCVAFFPVHRNVLQYKQTSCMRARPENDLDTVCLRSFRGDAPMITLFRVDATTERCPLDTPLNFTYSFIDGTCSSRISTVTACANPHRFRFLYQACPEISHSETHAVELECIAKWWSFGVEYFATRIVNSAVSSPATKLRCMIHERSSSEGRLGISADASCSELTDISSASTIIKYKLDSKIVSRCHFPNFLSRNHSSHIQRKWRSIVTDYVHKFNKEEWIEKFDGQNKSVSICIDNEDLGNAHKLIVYTTNGCNIGYQCVKIVKRKKNIIEILRGRLLLNEFNACDQIENEHIETLLLEGSGSEKCPVRGRHTGPICPSAVIHIGCQQENNIQLAPQCNSNFTQNFICRGHWSEDDVYYMIVEEIESSKKSCHIYSELPSGMVRIRSYRHIACHPQAIAQSAPQYDFNSTHFEDCKPEVQSNSMRNSGKFSTLIFSISIVFSIIFSSFTMH